MAARDAEVRQTPQNEDPSSPVSLIYWHSVLRGVVRREEPKQFAIRGQHQHEILIQRQEDLEAQVCEEAQQLVEEELMALVSIGPKATNELPRRLVAAAFWTSMLVGHFQQRGRVTDGWPQVLWWTALPVLVVWATLCWYRFFLLRKTRQVRVRGPRSAGRA